MSSHASERLPPRLRTRRTGDRQRLIRKRLCALVATLLVCARLPQPVLSTTSSGLRAHHRQDSAVLSARTSNAAAAAAATNHRGGVVTGAHAGGGEEGFVEVAASESVDASTPNKKSDEYRFAVNCDTADGCKMMLAENKISCCMLCLDDTSFFGHDPYYGFYEFVEQDPWAPREQHQGASRPDSTAPVAEQAIEITPQPANPDLDHPTVVNSRPKAAMPDSNPTLRKAAKRKKKFPPPEPSVMTKCKPPADDDFRLPCCQFCPRSTLSDSAAPLLVGSRFGGLLSNIGLPKVPCCAAPGSCCRWCPEYVCPYLQEYTVQTRLWWHVCGSWNQDDFPKDWQTNTIDTFGDHLLHRSYGTNVGYDVM